MAEYQILLFYKYIIIENPEELVTDQKQLWNTLGLKGRMLIAKEGINGTLEGTKENTEKYIQDLTQDPRFADVNFKKSEGTGSAFPKATVKVRKEIVSSHLGERDIDPTKVTGKYLEAEGLHSWFEQGKEFYIVDMRNDYEHQVGHFENSILPNLRNFRDLNSILPELRNLNGKPIVTVCTGGVRCEKASGFLIANGFEDVYQLHNGIVTYMEKYPNENFLGKLYVFDGRVVMGFHTDAKEHQIIGHCGKCNAISEHYVNCGNDECHLHFICCENCLDANNKGYCSEECNLLVQKNFTKTNNAIKYAA